MQSPCAAVVERQPDDWAAGYLMVLHPCIRCSSGAMQLGRQLCTPTKNEMLEEEVLFCIQLAEVSRSQSLPDGASLCCLLLARKPLVEVEITPAFSDRETVPL